MCSRERFTNFVPSSSLTQSAAGAHLHVQPPTANRDLASFLQGRLRAVCYSECGQSSLLQEPQSVRSKWGVCFCSGHLEDNRRPRRTSSESGISPVHQNLHRLAKPSASQSPKIACSHTPASCPQVYATGTGPLRLHCRSMNCAGERTPCCSERKMTLA